MEMVGAILFAVLLYVITTELSLFVARRRARAVPRQTRAAGSGVLSLRKTRHLFDGPERRKAARHHGISLSHCDKGHYRPSRSAVLDRHDPFQAKCLQQLRRPHQR